MSFKPRKQEEVPRDGRSLPAEGRHTFALTKVETKTSSKRHPQMVFTYTIDAGPDSGNKVWEYYTFSDNADLTWSRLACLCDAAKFTWKEFPTLETFAAQFPTDGTFRFSAEIEHRYSIKAYLDTLDLSKSVRQTPFKTGATPHEKWLNVSEEEYEAFEGEKRAGAKIREGFDFQNIYKEAEAEAELPAKPSGKPKAAPVEEEEFVLEQDDLPF